MGKAIGTLGFFFLILNGLYVLCLGIITRLILLGLRSHHLILIQVDGLEFGYDLSVDLGLDVQTFIIKLVFLVTEKTVLYVQHLAKLLAAIAKVNVYLLMVMRPPHLRKKLVR